ncbi:MAG TPA: citrate/2-methylcitrate synthase, partial [Leifsonia sp.]
VIETTFAAIEDGRLLYRGHDSSLLAQAPFEAVARWALHGAARGWSPPVTSPSPGDAPPVFRAPAGVADARRTAGALPRSATHRDRQQVAVTAFAAADPLRYSLEPESVASAAEALVAGMVDVLPALSSEPGEAVADRLWARLTIKPLGASARQRLNAALVLLLDHDLAVSTLAARAAASARANPYAVVTAGLGALDSPLHGNASRAAHRMLERVVRGDDPGRVVADTVVSGRGPVPGFGQPLYPAGDPRATVLLGMLAEDPEAAGVAEAVRAVVGVVRGRTGLHPNVDLALAALALASGMPDDAGEVIFATGRTVGWVVHALDEYSRAPLRLRPVGRYAG